MPIVSTVGLFWFPCVYDLEILVAGNYSCLKFQYNDGVAGSLHVLAQNALYHRVPG